MCSPMREARMLLPALDDADPPDTMDGRADAQFVSVTPTTEGFCTVAYAILALQKLQLLKIGIATCM